MEEPVLIPEELRQLPRALLERYVFERIRQFSRVFAEALNAPPAMAEVAFEQSWAQLSAVQQTNATFTLKFSHHCRFLACSDKSCGLCVNNPDKRCAASDNFDEAYADNQTLKAKCKAEVFVQAILDAPESGAELPSGLQVQLFVVDGECCADDVPRAPDSFKELLKSDEGVILLSGNTPAGVADPSGHITGTLQGGTYRLPDVSITDKTDTFRKDGQTFSSFRLVARAVQVDVNGQTSVMQNVAPAISSKFVIKTQRALNDFSKPSYPHHKDRLTRLKYIGGVTAERLRDIQTHIPGVPFSSIETVEQLRQLMLYTDQNRQIEGKLLDVLSMKGRHKHKWDYLRDVLTEKIVYDDALHRVWYADDMQSQGVLFTCKQGLVVMDKPFGLVERLVVDRQPRLRVITARDADRAELMRSWRNAAEEAWLMPGHPGWAIATEPMELAEGSSSQQLSGGAQQLGDAMEGLQMTGAMEDGSNPNSMPWQLAERHSGMQGPGFHNQYIPAGNSPSHNAHNSPHRLSAVRPDVPGAFHFTAQRAIGELKPRLSGSPHGSGNYSNHPDIMAMAAAAGRASSGETTPLAMGIQGYANAFAVGTGSPHTGASSSPHLLRLQATHSPASGSPVGSPRCASPMIDRSALAPRSASFSHQRARQVSSSAECTPNKPVQHTPLLSMFARSRDVASQGGSGSMGHVRVPQDFSQQPTGFQSSTDQAATAKRRRASLPDYSGNMYADAAQLMHRGSQGMPPPSSTSPPGGAMDLAPQQLHGALQRASGGAPYGLNFGAVLSPEAAQALTPEQQAMIMNMDRFSDGMIHQPHSLDSPNLLASIEQCLHLSDHGIRSLPAGVRTSSYGEAQQRSSMPAQRAAPRALNLAAGHSESQYLGSPHAAAHVDTSLNPMQPRPSYATSATGPSVASRQSLLHRGLNLAANDPRYDRQEPSFSPSSASVPSAGSGQSAGAHQGGLQLAGGPGPAYSPGGHEAASAFVADAAAAPSPATMAKYDEEQVDRWFDHQAQAMNTERSSDSQQGGVVDKQLTRMMERSGSFGRLLDSMLASARSCELTPENLGLN